MDNTGFPTRPSPMIKVLRTSLLSLVLAGLTVAGYWHLRLDRQQQALEELRALNADMVQRLQEREAMIARLSRSRRLAHVHTLDQRRGEDGAVTETTVLFIELDDAGAELARQQFTIPGEVLFIDAWTVKFDHERVAAGHPLLGRTLVLLRRIYSDRMAPVDGLPLDTPGAIPPGYAVDGAGQFEKHLWEHFWQIATDAALARSMEVRVAQGEAVYKPIAPGQTFELLVDAAGGMSLTPLPVSATAAGALSQAGG